MRERERELESTEQGTAELEHVAEAQPAIRQGAGQIPQVGEAGERGAGGELSASERAYDVASADTEDPNVVELKAKVGTMVDKRFGGDYRKAFDHYDADRDGGVGKDELVSLLKDAGVGNGITRGAWANGILEKVDTGHDSKIQWTEFQTVFGGTARA
ncbi:MAG: EF-hand domain-containing protein [Kofleriaceae bacterium]